MIDIDAVARACVSNIDLDWNQHADNTSMMVSTIAAALRERDAEWQAKLDREIRLLREQIRVGDVAFQHLHATSKGNPLPDWVKDGLPNMYALLAEFERLRGENKRLTDENHTQAATINGLRLPRADWP